jgi:hypothetical protein
MSDRGISSCPAPHKISAPHVRHRTPSGTPRSALPFSHNFLSMVFKAHAGLHLDQIPDDITVPELIFNPKHGRRPLSQSNTAVLIDAPSGSSYTLEQMKGRMEALAKGLRSELDVRDGWNGVIGLFSPNHVLSFKCGAHLSRSTLQRYSGQHRSSAEPSLQQTRLMVLMSCHIN